MFDCESMTLSHLWQLADVKPTGITMEKALKICSDTWSTDRATAGDIFHLWLTKLFKVFDHTQFTTKDWSELLTCLKRIIMEMALTSPSENEWVITKLSKWLSNSVAFLKTMQHSLPPLNAASSWCLVLGSIAYTLTQFHNFYDRWHQQYDLKGHFQVGLALHNLLLKALNETIDSMAAVSDSEFGYLTELSLTLCHMGERTQHLDIKTTIETWKCIVKVTTHCRKTEQSNRAHPGEWAKRPALFLCSEIARNCKVIYRQDTLKQPIKHVEQYLKIINFYIKLLHMLASKFGQQDFLAATEFLEVLSTTESMPAYLGNTPVAELFEKYVRTHLSDIFPLVYKNTLVEQFFRAPTQDYKCDSILRITMKYLKASVTAHDSEHIDSHATTYTHIFDQLFAVMTCFIEPKQYDTIVEYYAALTILCRRTSVLKAFFKRTLLEADFPRAHASCEVLLLVLRYSHASGNYRGVLNDFRYWRQCNDCFALHSHSPKQLHVQRLLRDAFQLCQSACPTLQKADLWDQYPENQIVQRSYRFHMAVGLSSTVSSDGALQMHAIKISDQLFELLAKFDAGASVGNYYKTVTFIKLLSSTHLLPKKELLERLFSLFATIHRHGDANAHQHFQLLLDACLRLAATHAHTMTESLLVSLLQCIYDKLSQQVGMPLASAFALLSACAKSPCRGVQELACTILQSCNESTVGSSGVRLASLVANIHLDNRIKGDRVADDFDETIDRSCFLYKQNCSCSCSPKATTATAKRIRLDDTSNGNGNGNSNGNGDGDGDGVRDILSELLRKSQSIAGLSGQLGSDDVALIHRIVDTLNKYTTIKQ